MIIHPKKAVKPTHLLSIDENDSEGHRKLLLPSRDSVMRWLLPAIAGAIAGAVAISCESLDNRTGISQELFARYTRRSSCIRCIDGAAEVSKDGGTPSHEDMGFAYPTETFWCMPSGPFPYCAPSVLPYQLIYLQLGTDAVCFRDASGDNNASFAALLVTSGFPSCLARPEGSHAPQVSWCMPDSSKGP